MRVNRHLMNMAERTVAAYEPEAIGITGLRCHTPPQCPPKCSLSDRFFGVMGTQSVSRFFLALLVLLPHRVHG